MIDLSLDPLTGDLEISGGDLVLNSGTEAIRQDWDATLRLFMGEWFLDPDAGVPYFQEILVDSPDTSRIAAILKAKTLVVDGITGIDSFSLSFDRGTRTLSVNVDATTVDGALPLSTSIPVGG